jgi:ankyrin repeat protein
MSDGPSEILAALYRGDQATVASLRASGVELDLFDAAGLGDVDRLTALLDAGADVNALAPDGFPPVGLAAFFGHPDAVRLLIERGADVNAQARNDMLVRPIHAAVAADNLEATQLLLDAGADPNTRQQGDYTPLDEAIHRKNAAIEAALRAAGATAVSEIPAD